MKHKIFVLTTLSIIFISHLTNTFSADNNVDMKKSNQAIIIRKPLLTAVLHSKLIEKVEIKEINFKPGQSTGIHIHPVPVAGYIAQGSILFQIEGQPSMILNEGDAFYEPADIKIIHFDNISNHQNTKFIAFYLLNNEDKELIHMIQH